MLGAFVFFLLLLSCFALSVCFAVSCVYALLCVVLYAGVLALFLLLLLSVLFFFVCAGVRGIKKMGSLIPNLYICIYIYTFETC